MSEDVCDALITDPPYSDKTHEGNRSSRNAEPVGGYEFHGPRPVIRYDPIDEAYCQSFVNAWKDRVRNWWVIFGDDVTNRWWLRALRASGFYTFAPVVWCKREAPPRFTGDGPASHCEYLAVARPKRRGFQGWGSLPGWYMLKKVGPEEGVGLAGAKPVELMRALVRDYSKAGWVIADPHAGTGSTLIASRIEGRNSIGSEKDADTFALARDLIAEPWTPDLFAPRAS